MKTLKTGCCSVDEVQIFGCVNSSQDGIIVKIDGVSPCHTAGHGNCQKVVIVIEN